LGLQKVYVLCGFETTNFALARRKKKFLEAVKWFITLWVIGLVRHKKKFCVLSPSKKWWYSMKKRFFICWERKHKSNYFLSHSWIEAKYVFVRMMKLWKDDENLSCKFMKWNKSEAVHRRPIHEASLNQAFVLDRFLVKNPRWSERF
jgi:hypothetical protein